MCPKTGTTVFLAIKKHTIGSGVIRFTSKHLKFEDIFMIVNIFLNIFFKIGFFRLFFRLFSATGHYRLLQIISITQNLNLWLKLVSFIIQDAPSKNILVKEMLADNNASIESLNWFSWHSLFNLSQEVSENSFLPIESNTTNQ